MHGFVGQVTFGDGIAAPEAPANGVALWAGQISLWVPDHSWHRAQVRCFEQSGTKLAVFGTCLSSDPAVLAVLARCQVDGGYARLAALPGSFAFVVYSGDRIHLFTDAVGLRAVYYRRYGLVLRFAESSLDLTEPYRDLDRAWVATRLMVRMPSLSEQKTPFAGVAEVPSGHCLTVQVPRFLGEEPVAQCWPYWAVPSGRKDLSDGAESLRQALVEAVTGRVEHAWPISGDLSGGLDSTSIAALAARAVPNRALVAVTMVGVDAQTKDDLDFAGRASLALPNIISHQVHTEMACVDGSEIVGLAPTMEPNMSTTMYPGFKARMQTVAACGSALHLSGQAGDAVLMAPGAYLADLAAAKRFSQLARHVDRLARQCDLSPWQLTRLAYRLNRTRYGQWVDQQAELLARVDNRPDQQEFDIAWASPAQPCPWASPEAVRLAVLELRTHAASAVPRTEAPGQHAALASIQTCARLARGLAELARPFGVRLEFPFLDRPVVDACLDTDITVRANPFEYKALLRRALQGLVPDDLLVRRTKSAYTRDYCTDARKFDRRLRELFSPSALSGLGLIDDRLFLTTLDRIAMGHMINLRGFVWTIETEIWLRRLLVNSPGSAAVIPAEDTLTERIPP
jgi:asparagine synthase (glutamine-hydrolysing)